MYNIEKPKDLNIRTIIYKYMVSYERYTICASCKRTAAIDYGSYGICYYCGGRFKNNKTQDVEKEIEDT